jgi:hypothetical protein
VPDASIRVEDQSANTWQNVEFSLPFLRQALASGLRLTVVSKWYHRRAVHALRTLLPEAGFCYAISWEPVYADAFATRETGRGTRAADAGSSANGARFLAESATAVTVRPSRPTAPGSGKIARRGVTKAGTIKQLEAVRPLLADAFGASSTHVRNLDKQITRLRSVQEQNLFRRRAESKLRRMRLQWRK